MTQVDQVTCTPCIGSFSLIIVFITIITIVLGDQFTPVALHKVFAFLFFWFCPIMCVRVDWRHFRGLPNKYK